MDYLRVPVTDEKAPKEHDFAVLVRRLWDLPSGAAAVFNCQACFPEDVPPRSTNEAHVGDDARRYRCLQLLAAILVGRAHPCT